MKRTAGGWTVRPINGFDRDKWYKRILIKRIKIPLGRNFDPFPECFRGAEQVINSPAVALQSLFKLGVEWIGKAALYRTCRSIVVRHLGTD